MPRAADALQAARDGLRALDLDHEVDRAHVDAELERGRGDEARDLPRLQELLDLDPLLARERAVVRAGDGRVRELVQAEGEPLRETAVVDEHDRRAVLLHELEQRRVDRGPDRARSCLVARGHDDVVREDRLAQARVGAGLAHVLERDDDLEVELLARARRRRARWACRPRRSGRSPRGASASRRGRCAGRAAPPPARAAPARPRGGRRAWCPRRRAPRRR